MLREIFYWCFNMSITAAITGVLVMLVRRVKRIPRRLTVILWLIPFFRMTVPFGLNSPYSLMSLLSRVTAKTVVVCQAADGVSFSMMNSVMAADSYFPITYKAPVLAQLFHIASVIWMTVFLALVLMLAAAYVATLHEIKGAKHLRDNLYLSEKAVSPAVYGILRPKIVLPVSCAGKETALILAHENMHIRRADNLWRVLAFLIAAVHWFNPLSWVFLNMFLTDLELSCDECVLARLGESRAKEYACSLLESKESTKVLASAFGGAKLRPRIENILSFKKITGLSLMVSLAWIAAVFYVLLTNAG